MCGIAGTLAGPRGAASEELLLLMAGELRHRGPDGVGLYLDGAFGMVNTRLSIIDIAGGDQPIGNEDGRYWVIQNGEIYNYPELREELQALGHRFTTRSDTEVLVHAFEQWGEGLLDHLNGEFAIAVWDRVTRELFLARDRFGIRPLFVAEIGGTLAFASEARALLRHPALTRELDPAALVDTFVLWTVLPSRSAFRGIRELAPGHYLKARDGRVLEERRWWDLRFGPREGIRQAPVAELAAELEALLDDATRIRLRADVPVGVYLSGGLDSSATAALARRHVRGVLRGFAVGFEDARFDERRYQDRMAEALGVELSRIVVGAGDIAQSFPRTVELAEKPMMRTAPSPLLRLSQLVQDSGFKVVLTGEGADEMFAGYNIFREAMIRRFWARRPSSKMRPMLLRRLYPYLSGDRGRGGAFWQAFFAAGLTDVDDPLYSHRIRMRNTGRNVRFLRTDVREAVAHGGSAETELLAALPGDFGDQGPLGRAQYLEIRTFMEGYLLHSQGDRMLMGHSVEGRFPFLDYRVAEFAAALPERLRLRDLEEKYLLRRSVLPLLPREIAEREKRPYRAPIVRAFVGEAAPAYVHELLAPEQVARVGLFDADQVTRLMAKAGAGDGAALGEPDEMALVGILSTMLLHDSMVERPTLAPAASADRIVRGRTVERPLAGHSAGRV